MNFLNTNSIHNILNFLMGAMGIITLILIKIGCTEAVNGALVCTKAAVPEWLLPWVIGIAGAVSMVKIVMNLVRDGFGGLWKQQPPVASSTTTVVVAQPEIAPKVEVQAPGATVIKK